MYRSLDELVVDFSLELMFFLPLLGLLGWNSKVPPEQDRSFFIRLILKSKITCKHRKTKNETRIV